ncbi:hypothetical protein MHBO_001272 [Bonamia ostreae]|uniref:Uncharacterized protein n=1 Tax=Bonamia ostreae TaxID=126728 RepID=A0ABV2AIF8_9EUKA
MAKKLFFYILSFLFIFAKSNEYTFCSAPKIPFGYIDQSCGKVLSPREKCKFFCNPLFKSSLKEIKCNEEGEIEHLPNCVFDVYWFVLSSNFAFLAFIFFISVIGVIFSYKKTKSK